MAHKITVTGKIMTGQSVTSYVINNVNNFFYDLIAGTLKVNFIPGAGATEVDNRTHEIDISGATSVVDTITSGQHAIVIS